MDSPSPFRLSSRARRRRPSPIREMVKYLGMEGMLSLAGGYPNPRTFAFERVTVELAGGGGPLVIEGGDLAAATQYGPSDALPALAGQLAQWQRFKDGVELPAGGLVVTNGSQEALYLLADVLLDEDDEVLVEEPTYPGALAAFRSFTERFTAVPLDGEGLRTDLLEELLAGRVARGEPLPRFLYTIVSGHNPAGVTLSEPRRRALAALARRFGLPIVEDDPYQLVQLDDDGGEGPAPRPPTLQSLAPEWVVRLDSFSKILCPGLRLGYASGPADVLRAMVLHKQASNLHTSTFAQALLAAFLRSEGFQGLLDRIRRNVGLYRRNRDAAVAAAHRHLPAGVRFTVPTAGMFLWFDLPEGCDGQRMLEEDALALKVALVPGAHFSTRGGLRNAMRASFSLIDPDQADEALRRFGEMVRRDLARAGR
jgi:DNA-binding transcriptional MocR family regulator